MHNNFHRNANNNLTRNNLNEDNFKRNGIGAAVAPAMPTPGYITAADRMHSATWESAREAGPREPTAIADGEACVKGGSAADSVVEVSDANHACCMVRLEHFVCHR